MDSTNKTIRARFDGKVFVPEENVELPVGATVTLQLPSSGMTQQEWVEFIEKFSGCISDPTFVEPEDLPEREVPSF